MRQADTRRPIPADLVSWGAGSKLATWNRQVLRQILEKNEAVNASRSPNEQKIGDMYATCMEQESSGANDLQAIQPLLAQIQKIQSKREIAGVLAAMHSSFGRAWEADDNQTNVAMFGYGPTPDYNDVSRVVAGVDQGGLGMPGRDFYLGNDAEMKAVRDKYVSLIVALLKMDGMSDADAMQSASAVLRIETAMAQAQMDNITRRDPNKTNNRFTLAQLKKLVPAFDWAAYFNGIGAPAVPLYEVSAPEYFRALNQLLVNEDLATWKLYLRWQLLRRLRLHRWAIAWRTANFEFFRR